MFLDFEFKFSDDISNHISEFISSHKYKLRCTINKELLKSDNLAREIINRELSKGMLPYLENIPIDCEENNNEYIYSRTLTILSEKDLNKLIHLLKSYYTRRK